jgi:hypothetical protein
MALVKDRDFDNVHYQCWQSEEKENLVNRARNLGHYCHEPENGSKYVWVFVMRGI